MKRLKNKFGRITWGSKSTNKKGPNTQRYDACDAMDRGDCGECDTKKVHDRYIQCNAVCKSKLKKHKGSHYFSGAADSLYFVRD